MRAASPGRAALAAIGRDGRRVAGLALACTLFVDCAILAVPLFDAHVLDDVLADRSLETLVALAGLCAAALLLHALMDWVRGGAFVVLADRVAHHADAPLLEACLARDLGAGLAAAGGPVRDLNEVRLFLGGGAAALPLDLLAAPFLAALLFALHPALGWLGLGGAALLLLLAVLSDGTARGDLAAGHAAAAAANAGLAARLREPDAVATLGLLDGICALWATEHGRARRLTAGATARARRVEGLSRLARLLLQGLVVGAAAAAATRGEATPGVTMASAVLFARLVLPMDQCVSGWRQWIVAIAAWRRVRAALLALPAPAAAGGDAPALAMPGLVVEGVAWAAPGGRAVLRGASLRVAPGEAVALAGANGAGKSTLARVAAGVLAPSAGRVLLDGRDLHRDPDRAGLAARVGLLPQAVLLLEGSVHDTIARFGTGPGSEVAEVVATARRAGAHELVGRLPRGYAAAVSPLGPELSGGQRQRLALARALHGSPRLLVLDEPDAHLDAEGEAALVGALRAARAEGTAVLLVSHRPALLAEADRVLTVADGILADAAPGHAPPDVARASA